MAGQAGASSATANPALLRRPEPAGKIARVHCGTRNTATPAAALRSGQGLRADRRYRRLREGVRDENRRSSPVFLLPNAHANRRTARSRSSRVKGFVTYPSAPCCCPQYLSLAVSLEVTRITGIILNWSLPFRSPQTSNPLRSDTTTSRPITR